MALKVDKIEECRLINHPLLSSSKEDGPNGFFATVPIRDKNGIRRYFNMQVSNGNGWEHVSVTIDGDAKRCPNWEEMSAIKELLWDDDDTVVQYHPAKSDYVNCHPYCLHLWRSLNEETPKPPSIFVGPSFSKKQ